MIAVLLAAPAGVLAIGFQVPGSNTTLDMGGYVKLDVIYNDVSAGDDSQANYEYSPSEVPLDDAEEGKDELVFNGRESRLWAKTTTPTAMGPLKTHLEMDFDTTESSQVVSNSRGMRLRHGYGTLKGFLFGQTWSLFMHLDSLPEINDFGGPTGSMFVRQPQLRYTYDMNDTMNFAVSVENAETYFYDGTGLNVVDDDNMPDAIGRFSVNPSWGNLSAAVMVRNLVVDAGPVDDSTVAVSGQVGAVLKLFAKDSLMGAIQYGQGIGRYSSLASHPDAYVTDNGDLESLDQLAGFVGYQHYWVGTWRSTVALGYSKADDPAELQNTDLTEETVSVHANLMFDPVENTRVGIEYIRGERETYDGQDGELNRIQFSAMVSF
ncbi:MAG: DcaP family trimeric outer membrane transporter [Desulfatitalea sp.]